MVCLSRRNALLLLVVSRVRHNPLPARTTPLHLGLRSHLREWLNQLLKMRVINSLPPMHRQLSHQVARTHLPLITNRPLYRLSETAMPRRDLTCPMDTLLGVVQTRMGGPRVTIGVDPSLRVWSLLLHNNLPIKLPTCHNLLALATNLSIIHRFQADFQPIYLLNLTFNLQTRLSQSYPVIGLFILYPHLSTTILNNRLQISQRKFIFLLPPSL